MPITDRAAQFSPFAALTGHDAAIRETARWTDRKIELDEDEKLVLNEKLRVLIEQIDQHPEVRVTYFQPDEKKDGGAYVTATGVVKKIDNLEKSILMTNGARIPIENVVEISGALFQDVDI
jgi:predicted nucleotidyltransferase